MLLTLALISCELSWNFNLPSSKTMCTAERKQSESNALLVS